MDALYIRKPLDESTRRAPAAHRNGYRTQYEVSPVAAVHLVELINFGGFNDFGPASSFSINHRPPRMGRNPRSGESVAIPEKRVPHFKPGKALREAVDRRTVDILPPGAVDKRRY